MAPNKREERILIIAPAGQDARAMAVRLQEAGYAVEICAGATEASREMASGVGALLLTEEALELGKLSDLLRALKSQPAWSEVPVIILTVGGESRRATLLDLAATAAGSITVLERPLGTATLLRSVEVALRSRRRQYRVRKLIEDKARLAAIVESSDDAIISKDLNGTVITWNAAAERLFGHSAAEMIGKSITMVIPRDRLDEESDILNRIGRGERVQHETVRQCKSGVWVDVSLSVSPIVDDDGRIIGASTIVRDITSRKRAEAALLDHKLKLQKALETAESASRAKDRFIATLSHELRTPLTPVLLTLGILREEPNLTPELRDSLEMMESHIEVQAQMIDDLLDLSRIANNKLVLNRAGCDFHHVIQRALNVCSAQGKAKGVTILLRLEAQRRQIHADANRLQQVLWNLIQNAIKFTPAGGAITIASHDAEECVVATVADTGRGIDPALLEKIFEPFEQAHDRASGGSQQGLGLGLAIARRVISAHGGTLQADSKGKDQGAVFTVKLPLQPG